MVVLAAVLVFVALALTDILGRAWLERRISRRCVTCASSPKSEPAMEQEYRVQQLVNGAWEDREQNVGELVWAQGRVSTLKDAYPTEVFRLVQRDVGSWVPLED